MGKSGSEAMEIPLEAVTTGLNPLFSATFESSQESRQDIASFKQVLFLRTYYIILLLFHHSLLVGNKNK